MTTNTVGRRDERLAQVGLIQQLFRRPEAGALVGAIGIYLVFSVIKPETFPTIAGFARILDNTTTIGIMAIGMAMLMIGGEFDLSIGVMTGTTAIITGMLTVEFGWPLPLAMAVSLVFAMSVGLFNGFVRIRTGLPSFIVTLGTMFFLRGANIAVTRLVTEEIRVAGIDEVPGFVVGRAIFNYEFELFGQEFRTIAIWWIVLTALAVWVMRRTKLGNWIFASGGDADATRSVGVPVHRVKIGLFVWAHFLAWLIGMMLMFRLRSALGSQGVAQEFFYLVAAAIGGNRMTGGYGSVIGAAIGAIVFGITRVGITFAGWDTDWYFSFVGLMLIVAVLLNLASARRAERVRLTAQTDSQEEDEPPEPPPASPPAEPPGEADGAVAQPARVPANGVAAVELRDVTKMFGNVIALKDVSLSVRSGEVTCLLGDNGAGKSSLIKSIAGVHEPTSGEILVDGEPVRFRSPRDPLDRGIATVYQDLALIPLMSVWRNFFLGAEPEKGRGLLRRLDVGEAKRIVQDELGAMGIDVRDPEQPVGTMSGGERQSLAIARAVHFGAKVLILDEPTAALGVKQAGTVLKYVAEARARGLAIIFITHNPSHAEIVGDRFVILRRGRVVADYDGSEVTREELIDGMAGSSDLSRLRAEIAAINRDSLVGAEGR